ncbi:MAG: Uncharacterized protein G01um101444_159 [Parcubacteria group bacterium Gr01-1014_44]|nr:MAG: Uncharacterized protein G01um101444_159 [Parcubacteria group bacterium Gr01-1014_44]
MNSKNNFAYIDGANLYKAQKELGWSLDYSRFRVWLYEKYNISEAYIFIGLIPKYKDLYTYLQKCGFTLVFKEVTFDGSGKPNGNCDADLVLQVVRDIYEHAPGKIVLITSDGDYSSLVKFLMEKDKFNTILSPAIVAKCSILLKRTGANIAYINDQKTLLEAKNEKAPDRDKTP